MPSSLYLTSVSSFPDYFFSYSFSSTYARDRFIYSHGVQTPSLLLPVLKARQRFNKYKQLRLSETLSITVQRIVFSMLNFSHQSLLNLLTCPLRCPCSLVPISSIFCVHSTCQATQGEPTRPAFPSGAWGAVSPPPTRCRL